MLKGSIGMRLTSATLLSCCLSPIHMEPLNFTSDLNRAKPSCAPPNFYPNSRKGDLGNLLQLQYNLLLDNSSQREPSPESLLNGSYLRELIAHCRCIHLQLGPKSCSLRIPPYKPDLLPSLIGVPVIAQSITV